MTSGDSAASAPDLAAKHDRTGMTGRGYREPLLSPDARHFGAARDGEQRSSPFLIRSGAIARGAQRARPAGMGHKWSLAATGAAGLGA